MMTMATGRIHSNPAIVPSVVPSVWAFIHDTTKRQAHEYGCITMCVV